MAAEREPAPRSGGGAPPGPRAVLAAKGLLAELTSASTELRAAAVFDPAGRQLASSDGRDWTARAAALWEAADRDDGDRPPPATQIHIGTELGEVLALRGEAGAVVATADRFVLASLLLSDLRALLRGLAASAADPEGEG